MTINGGYVQVDGTGVNLLAGETQTIPGLYKKMIEAIGTGKPIQVCNCQYGSGVAMTPIPIFCIIEAGVVIGTASILQLRVNESNEVWVVNLLS